MRAKPARSPAGRARGTQRACPGASAVPQPIKEPPPHAGREIFSDLKACRSQDLAGRRAEGLKALPTQGVNASPGSAAPRQAL